MSLSGIQHLLIIEHDPTLGQYLYTHLNQQGFEATWCQTGKDGENMALHFEFDLILLNTRMPDRDSLDILKEVHSKKFTPTILLSAKYEEQECLAGFTYGADDYVLKPFNMPILCARINALLKRVQIERFSCQNKRLEDTDSPFYFDAKRSDVRYEQNWLELTSTEFRLLRSFWYHRESVLSKTILYQQVLNRTLSPTDRVLDMHVSNIRRKMQKANCTDYNLLTAFRQGYVLRKAPH
ncbi:response regulator transcription factor [Ectopseudomonas hydrolytica]|uniref:Response regulator transcription factor n=1 Tax=Ectopseudomonas hydrolytica TaxID=2493633 RepID=A0ABY5A1P8_9GAMM|nr:response regulator transcription factor [Pseudomonas hydrolytica]OCX15293.1 hypothetical protein BBI09_16045 [Stutzerimonas xanthomarina]USR37665.1 response regulator transcription factor [Pseudomonas hydrolytica]